MDLRPEDVIPPIRTARSRDFYLAYLNSSSWRFTRNRALQRTHYRCERCDSKRDLQVHHRTYERLGAECDEDLEVLCANCHEGEHVDQMAQSADAIYLKLAREAVRQEFMASISDLAERVKTLCAQHKISYDSGRITRALELVTGSAVTRVEAPLRADGTTPDPRQLTRQETHELLCRLDLAEIMDRLIKPMPTIGKSAAEQRVHEDRLEAQIRAEHCRAYQAERRRSKVPIEERLEQIFAGGYR